MDVKLKKFDIVKPKVDIRTDIKTLSQEKTNAPLVPMLLYIRTLSAGNHIIGNLEILEV